MDGLSLFHFGYKNSRLGYSQEMASADLCCIINLKYKMMAQHNGTSGVSKVWFITGASRGFGRVWAEAALKRGDKVAATARTLASIADLKDKYSANVLTLELDVTKPDQVKTALAQAHDHFGRLDIVLNNAGYSLVGTIEEASAEEARALYGTNVFEIGRAHV